MPTEARLVALIRAAEGPLDTATISGLIDRHPNGVRVQLQRLERAGVLVCEHSSGDVGRPRALWRLTPRAIAEADLPHTGWAMARSLARTIPATPARLREVEQAGTEMGRELAGRLGPADGGRRPRGVRRRARGARLRAAPHRRGRARPLRAHDLPVRRHGPREPRGRLHAAPRDRPGRARVDHPDAALTGFEPKDPDPAGCIVEITLEAGAADAALALALREDLRLLLGELLVGQRAGLAQRLELAEALDRIAGRGGRRGRRVATWPTPEPSGPNASPNIATMFCRASSPPSLVA